MKKRTLILLAAALIAGGTMTGCSVHIDFGDTEKTSETEAKPADSAKPTEKPKPTKALEESKEETKDEQETAPENTGAVEDTGDTEVEEGTEDIPAEDGEQGDSGQGETVIPDEEEGQDQEGEITQEVNDPYDLYSWDIGTCKYIPFQQAGGDGSPIGRGNGWYYYDEASGEYLPW